MNYVQLTAAIKGYAENDFPNTVGSFTSADQIATFVKMAEQRVYNIRFISSFPYPIFILAFNKDYKIGWCL